MIPSAQRAVMGALRRQERDSPLGLTANEIAKRLDSDIRNVRNLVSSMRKLGILRRHAGRPARYTRKIDVLNPDRATLASLVKTYGARAIVSLAEATQEAS